ncbi:MAG TPA: tyrosine--tRNA ligase [Candidatus Paceibacterota bacterium]|nr:tyrosine--tRNA ligase [Candidatus Paceibacterota bacterium]
MKMITDENILEDILTRSISKIYPSKEILKDVLLSGKKMRIYMGIDPTATYAHIGHSTNYILLKKFHDLGHSIVVLIGDFTARIGDPSDKTSLRKKLSALEIKNNLKTFKKQIGKIIEFNDKKNPVQFVFNSKWLASMPFEEVMDIASNFTLQQMVERDMFQKRIKENKPIYIHEFFYPLMQGYDSVALNADIEVGGTDQTFNMLAGRILVKNLQGREKFVITTTLLENPITKEKLMSKSLGTGVGLDETPESMYGGIMAQADVNIPQLFTDCTYIPLSEIDKIKNDLNNNKINPRDLKMKLAYEIVKIYHGEKKAKDAQKNFVDTFQKKEIPKEIPELKSKTGELVSEVLVKNKILSSKSEWRRLVLENAIHDLSKNQNITDVNLKLSANLTLKIGKKKFIKISHK